MRISKIVKEFEEEIVLPNWTVVRIRNKVAGYLTEEEENGGADTLKKLSNNLYKIARSLTRADIDKEIKKREQ